jgi:integrase/recombinase XerD
MLVQEGRLPNSTRPIWLVLDDNYQPIEPITAYLRYLDSLEKSPNTVRTYAYNLKLYWEFLHHQQLHWQEVNLEQLADFIHWLRNPQPAGVMSIQPQTSNRTEKTINHALNTVSMFYEFHIRLGQVQGVTTHTYQVQPGRKFKPFLHHISKGKEVKTRLLRIREPKTFPGCLSAEQVKELLSGCHRIRDKFLICLLYETGMRIGEVLGLRHEDIRSQGVNEIHVIPRADNINSSSAKSGVPRVLHVSKELLKLYSSYLIEEYPDDIDCDYVFVNCWDGEIGKPMRYGSVEGLFKRLEKKTGIKVNPHLLRHTHATELIRAGWDMAHVQKRLGHSSIQTTINTYVHLTEDDLRQEYDKYLATKEDEHGTANPTRSIANTRTSNY